MGLLTCLHTDATFRHMITQSNTHPRTKSNTYDENAASSPQGFAVQHRLH